MDVSPCERCFPGAEGATQALREAEDSHTWRRRVMKRKRVQLGLGVAIGILPGAQSQTEPPLSGH